jgi:hypothetical protein
MSENSDAAQGTPLGGVPLQTAFALTWIKNRIDAGAKIANSFTAGRARQCFVTALCRTM